MISLGKLKIHIGFLLLCIFTLFYGNFIQILMAFIAVTIHEISHIFSACLLGGKISEIYITPIGESAKIDNFWKLSQLERIFILLCGPISNILMGVIILGITNIFKDFQYNYVLLEFVNINFIIAIFNFIPIIPLDGGNILYTVFGRKYGVIRTAKFMTNMEFVFGFIIMVLGIIQVILYPFNISFLVIGAYFVFSKRKEYLERISDFYITVIDKNRDYYLRPMNIRKILYSGDFKNILRYLNYDDYFFIYIRLDNGFIIKRSMEEIINDIF